MRARAWTTAAIATAAALFFVFAFAQQPGVSPASQPGKAPPKGAVEGRLTWFDRQGKVVGTLGAPGIYRTLQISPDGKKVAFERTDPATQNRDIWLIDVASSATTRFTSDPAWEAFPTWSPDGSRIVYTSNRSGVYELYVKPVNGSPSEELFYRSSEGKGPNSWSPDGKYMVYYTLGQPTHLRMLSLAGPEPKATPLVDPQYTSITGRFSPNGQWIVYVSNESGKTEISVRAFEASTGAVGSPMALTKGGGRTPLWRGDGKEIFYVAPDGMAMAMEVKTADGFEADAPKSLFRLPAGVLFWDVSPDGQRFLMPAPGA